MSERHFNRLPVLIPAYNEEEHLFQTLSRLPAGVTEPIVVVNGSTDRTAAIAEDFGVRTEVFAEQGKLPAIQKVLTKLADAALGPLMILDADTHPVYPRSWSTEVMARLATEPSDTPQALGCPVWFKGGDPLNSSLRSARRVQRAVTSRINPTANTIAQCGPAMGIHLKTDQALERILELPHYWPSEDRAIANCVIAAGGRYDQSISPLLLTVSPPSISFLSLAETKKLGLEAARHVMLEHYRLRGAPGSIPFSPTD